MIKKMLRYLLRRSGWKISRIGPYLIFDFESFLYRYLLVHKKMLFVQIGANDGIMNDPIYQFNIANKDVVSGFVLEPLPDIFEKLVKNYKSCQNIKPINLAIHSTQSEAILHRIKPERAAELPTFAHGIASFSGDHWKKTTIVPNPDFMEQVKVKCISFSEFAKVNGIKKNLDLLIVDTEGYDYEILLSIDFSIIKPRIIHFEHGVRNALMSSEQFMSISDHLNAHGYQIIAESYDATAYLLDPKDTIF